MLVSRSHSVRKKGREQKKITKLPEINHGKRFHVLSNITRGGLCQFVCVFPQFPHCCPAPSHVFITAGLHNSNIPLHHHHHHPPQHAAHSHNLDFSGRRNNKCFYSLFYFTGFYVRACARGSRVNQACALLKNNCHLLCRGQNMKTPQRLFFYFFSICREEAGPVCVLRRPLAHFIRPLERVRPHPVGRILEKGEKKCGKKKKRLRQPATLRELANRCTSPAG